MGRKIVLTIDVIPGVDTPANGLPCRQLGNSGLSGGVTCPVKAEHTRLVAFGEVGYTPNRFR